MSDPLPTAQHSAVSRVKVSVTPERAQTFLEVLRKTGSLSAAAAAASPHLVARGSTRCGIGTFREYAHRNPEFAAAVEATMTAVIGEAESLVWQRATTPDEKPIFNPKTGELHLAVDHRNANQMLLAFLAHHDPSSWATKTRNETTVTVNNPVTSGAQFVIKPDDILLLADPEDQRTLVALLEKIESARTDAPAAVPTLHRPYAAWSGDGPAPTALPAPEGEAA